MAHEVMIFIASNDRHIEGGRDRETVYVWGRALHESCKPGQILLMRATWQEIFDPPPQFSRMGIQVSLTVGLSGLGLGDLPYLQFFKS